MSSCDAIVMCDYKFLTKMYKIYQNYSLKAYKEFISLTGCQMYASFHFPKGNRAHFVVFFDIINFISRLYNLRL